MLNLIFFNDYVRFLSKGFEIIFILLSGVHLSYGQYTISGKVLDETSKEPLEKVNIFLTKNTDFGTTTDENGSFHLEIKAGFEETDSITFSIIGYKTLKTTITSLKEVSTVIRETRTLKNPSSDIFKIELSEFKKTKVIDLKTL